ncbi:DUF2145 domain-containing protein [Mariprofundus erugo]|uniref:DUF2145 domain-containing protein n=1 Tax=Mariprofundus erugo TaxID=2528639 RepID=UPI0013C324EB|nr:DUF2145 domain-containing protein [Mariprofundus erugo]
MKPYIYTALALILLFVLNGKAEAGSMAGGEPQFSAEQIVSFAKKVEKTVAARGARVFILARAGRPASEMPDGFHYTHVAFGVYSTIKTDDGRDIAGYAIYNLYQDDKQADRSRLVQDYPVDFFASVFELKSGIVIPRPELQKRLLDVIASDTYKKLHNPAYSVVANPYNNRYQNCTEFTLDIIQAAIYNTADTRVIKANNRAYFKAQEVHVSPLKLLLGSITMPDLKTGDQSHGIRTASYTTIAGYLKQYNLVQEELLVTP